MQRTVASSLLWTPGTDQLGDGDPNTDFRRYARDLMGHNFPKVGLFVAALVAGMWPLDPLLFSGERLGAMAWVRFFGITATLGLTLIPARLGWYRRAPVLTGALSIGVVYVATGWAIARHFTLTGGLAGVFYCLVFLPVGFVVPWGQRALVELTLCAAAVGGMLLGRPETLGSEQFPMFVILLAFSALIATGLGAILTYLVQTNFLQRRQIRDFSLGLEQIIREQTSELRSLVTHVETLRDDDRRYLARELHDELGQELGALRYTLDYAQSVSGDAHTSALIGECRAIMDRTRTTVRRVLTQLRPAMLDEVGLLAALEALVNSLPTHAGLQVSLAVGPVPPGLDARVAHAIYRVVQEGLNNVVRHAHAGHAAVTVAFDPDTVQADIVDDGRGISERAVRDGGFGLVGVRERASTLGGTVSLRPVPGGGTALTVTLPVVPPAPPDGEGAPPDAGGRAHPP